MQLTKKQYAKLDEELHSIIGGKVDATEDQRGTNYQIKSWVRNQAVIKFRKEFGNFYSLEEIPNKAIDRFLKRIFEILSE